MPIEPAPAMRATIGAPAGAPVLEPTTIAPGVKVSLNLGLRKVLATSDRGFILTYNNPSGCIPYGLKARDLAHLQQVFERGEIVLGEAPVKAPPSRGLLEPIYEELDKASQIGEIKGLVFKIASRQKHLGSMTPAEALRHLISHESTISCRGSFLNFLGSVLERTAGHAGVEDHVQDNARITLPADEKGKPILNQAADRSPAQKAAISSLI